MAAVNVKFLPFWANDPQVWFAQVEAQFATRGITVQKTKFDYIIASLAPEFATEVRDLVLSPPAEHPYDKLKEQLIKRTATSEQKRLQLLLNAEELGDRKPMQLLHRMQQLLGEKAGAIDESLLRELFLQYLSANIRMVLASTGDTVSLEDLAQLADKIMEVAAPSVSSLSSPQLASEMDQHVLRSPACGSFYSLFQWGHANPPGAVCPALLPHTPHPTSAGTTSVLETTPSIADSLLEGGKRPGQPLVAQVSLAFSQMSSAMIYTTYR